MLNIYHAGFLPSGINSTKLHRLHYVYLDGLAEAPDYKDDAPDICLADVPLNEINDGRYIDCTIWSDGTPRDGWAFIWSYGAIAYKDGIFAVQGTLRREGLICLASDEARVLHADESFGSHSI